MPEYLAPGVYIEEIERGPRPIEGVATSTAAFLGETLRGPTRPKCVISFSQYLRSYGGSFDDDNFMPDALSGFFENGGKRAYVCRVAGAGAVSASREVGGLNIEAIGPGAWGDRIFVKLSDSSRVGPDGHPYGFRLRIAFWPEPTTDSVYPDPFDPPQEAAQATPIVEDVDDLVWDDLESADHYSRRLGGASVLVTVSPKEPGELTEQPAGNFGALAGGADGLAPTVNDFLGLNADPVARTGLAALELDEYREVALIAAPAATADVVDAIIEHCEQSRSRFAVVDAAPQSDPASLNPHSKWDASYAALYYPWIYLLDPQSEVQRLVPPCGHIAGIYARTDIDRGVWKAPANEIMRGAVDLEFHIDKQTQEILNPRGVNAIRQFPGRGIRVWGARTLSTNPLWKYVSVRRLFIFLERSIYEGTQWVVFEPNGEALWERVKDTIRLFLREQWRNGALLGRTEDQAFAITCDRSTMTQDDILNGRLICEVAVAPVRPAEFVVFRIFQQTAEAQI
jgi:uncharacterized protein